MARSCLTHFPHHFMNVLAARSASFTESKWLCKDWNCTQPGWDSPLGSMLANVGFPRTMTNSCAFSHPFCLKLMPHVLGQFSGCQKPLPSFCLGKVSFRFLLSKLILIFPSALVNLLRFERPPAHKTWMMAPNWMELGLAVNTQFYSVFYSVFLEKLGSIPSTSFSRFSNPTDDTL